MCVRGEFGRHKRRWLAGHRVPDPIPSPKITTICPFLAAVFGMSVTFGNKVPHLFRKKWDSSVRPSGVLP